MINRSRSVRSARGLRRFLLGGLGGIAAGALLLIAPSAGGQEVIPTTGIILSATPSSVSEGASSVTFTISARFASGTGDITARAVSYTIAFPSGITPSPNTLTGTVTIPMSDVDATVNHASLTLSGMDNSVIDSTARNITISGSVAAAPSLTVHSATVPITDDDNAVTLTLSSGGSALSEVTEGSSTAVTVTASLPTGTTAPTSQTALTITVGGAADTAAAGTDFTAVSPFTLNIPANSLSGTATFTLAALSAIPDGDSRTLTVSGAASGFTFTNAGLTINAAPPAPVDPDPTDPTDPTEPTDPTGPTEPTGPTDPTDPAGPSGPAAPPPGRPEDPYIPPRSLADSLPGWSACLGPSGVATRFADVADWDADPAIRCVSYYRIALGRTPTMFAPTELVPRWQMALFLYRAAVPAGVALPAEPTDQGFTDVDGMSEEARAAANSLAELGIMPGTAATKFSPQDLVSRRSMALLIYEFLRAARLQPGVAVTGDQAPGPTGFNDLGELSPAERRAVARLFALGVVQGVSENSFAPEDTVTRVQMVRFIARALGFTAARPAGVSLQADRSTASGRSVDLVVSVRDANFRPVVGARVDMFKAFRSGEVFGDTGRCLSAGLVAVAGGRVCQVDAEDPVTGAAGDARVRLEGVTSGQRVWAWTGAIGDEMSDLVRFSKLMFVL